MAPVLSQLKITKKPYSVEDKHLKIKVYQFQILT
jgi:hypothetical protein